MAKKFRSTKNPDSFLKKPIFEGGVKAMRELIKRNMKYPALAIEKKVEGTVKVKYDIDYKGRVIKTKVIKGIGHGCDEEAERLVKMFKFKINKTRKVRVIYHKNIQIHFRLPEKKAKPKIENAPAQSINYITSTSSSTQKPGTRKSYSYTIKYR